MPIVFAHRGASSECRGNTMAAFVRALELGAQGLESDAWITADGEVVLDHDGVRRRRLKRQSIASLPRRELPRHIPSLRQLYDECGTDFELSIDVKDPAAAEPAVALAGEAGAIDRLWLCHGDRGLLEGWYHCDPRLHLVLSTDTSSIPTGASNTSARTSGTEYPLRDVLPEEVLTPGGATGVAKVGSGTLDAVNLHRRDWSDRLVLQVHSGGLMAFAWGVERTSDLERLIGWGINAVYSNHIRRMLHVLRDAQGIPRTSPHARLQVGWQRQDRRRHRS